MTSPTEWTVATLKEHMESLRTSDQKALKLQAAEYERRLEALNHAHERAEEALATYVPRETYEQQHKQLEDALDEFGRWRATLTGRTAAFGLVGAVVVALVSGFITHLTGA